MWLRCRRRIGTSDHIRVSYATSKAELDRGLERMRSSSQGCRHGIHRHKALLMFRFGGGRPFANGLFSVSLFMGNLYPFLMLPGFDPRPWGTHDLSPIYPNRHFERRLARPGSLATIAKWPTDRSPADAGTAQANSIIGRCGDAAAIRNAFHCC